jgi:hypothetical protein
MGQRYKNNNDNLQRVAKFKKEKLLKGAGIHLPLSYGYRCQKNHHKNLLISLEIIGKEVKYKWNE